MIKIDVKIDISGFESKLNSLKNNQVPFAAAKALTATAKLVAEAEKREMIDVFDRPRSNTLNSIFVTPATKLSLISVVGLKNFAGKGIPASKYLAAQILGGQRRLKRFEKALQSVGAMPVGYMAVPGDAAIIDGNGNMSGGQIVQILSFFKAFPEMGYRANMTDKGRKSLARGKKDRKGFSYFVGRPGDRLPLGIWQRFTFFGSSAIKPVIIFVPHTNYEARFDFYDVARRVVAREWPRVFKSALADAIRTAK